MTAVDSKRKLHTPLQIHGYASAYRFGFQHLQLAMARHRLGSSYGMDLNALSVVEGMIYFSSQTRTKTTKLLSVEPQVVADELYLRVQQWTMFDGEDLSPAVDRIFIEICAHINRFSWTRRLISDLIRCKLQQADSRPDCATCHRFLKCEACAIEFRIEARQLRSGRGKALVMTKWIHLGRGEHMDDQQWRRHLYDPQESVFGSRFVPASSEDSRSCGFETGYWKPQASLTDEMADILETGSFLKSFERARYRGKNGCTVY